jgi:hypothetical protein
MRKWNKGGIILKSLKQKDDRRRPFYLNRESPPVGAGYFKTAGKARKRKKENGKEKIVEDSGVLSGIG